MRGDFVPKTVGFTRAEIEEMRREAREYPFMLFGCMELAATMGLHPDIITAVVKHRESPFLKATKKARPEWVMDFLRQSPADFDVPKKVA